MQLICEFGDLPRAVARQHPLTSYTTDYAMSRETRSGAPIHTRDPLIVVVFGGTSGGMSDEL